MRRWTHVKGQRSPRGCEGREELATRLLQWNPREPKTSGATRLELAGRVECAPCIGATPIAEWSLRVDCAVAVRVVCAPIHCTRLSEAAARLDSNNAGVGLAARRIAVTDPNDRRAAVRSGAERAMATAAAGRERTSAADDAGRTADRQRNIERESRERLIAHSSGQQQTTTASQTSQRKVRGESGRSVL